MCRRLKDVPSIDNKHLFYIVIFLVNMLFAPIIFLSCIVPAWSARFQDSLYTELFRED